MSDEVTSESAVRGCGNVAPVEQTYAGDSEIPIATYSLNHPKAYIGYSVAVAASKLLGKPADKLTEEFVVGDVSGARRGAESLNLVRGQELTSQGEHVTRRAATIYGGYEEALESLDQLRGTRKRFTDLSDKWSRIAPSVAYGDPAIANLLLSMKKIQRGSEGYALPDLVMELYREQPQFTVEFFISDSDRYRDYFGSDTVSREDMRDMLQKPGAYRTTATYQVKSILYHLGLLTERGSDSSSLEPVADKWRPTSRI